MNARQWQREPGLQPRYSLTLHTMRIIVVRAVMWPAWIMACRELGIADSPIPGSASMEPEAAQSAALAIVRERIGTMAEEMAGVDL